MANGKNTHLEHIDELIFNEGFSGLRQSIVVIAAVRDMLSGNTKGNYNITTKWDGAPAIICGKEPESGNFFIGTKSVFNKEPKLNFSEEDIDKNHPGEGLSKKLKAAFRALSKLEFDEVLQGDLMFTKEDLKVLQIDGEKYLTFQPNTILYAVPVDSNFAKKIQSSEIGVVFHTKYTGKKISEMTASFNVNVEKYKNVNNIWISDVTIKDLSGTATLTYEEMQEINSNLSNVGRLFQKLSSSFIRELTSNLDLIIKIKTFINSEIRYGRTITSSEKYTDDMLAFLQNKYNEENAKLSRPESKQKHFLEKNKILSLLKTNRSNLITVFDIIKLILLCKNILIRKLEKINTIGTFIKKDFGYEVTAPEGFVISDHMTNKAVKLVDRLEFSKQNFTAVKNWTK